MSKTDYTDEETKALEAASDTAGEYLEHLGKTDMATFTEEEWFDLLMAVVHGYSEFFRQQESPEKAKYDKITEDEIPF